MQPEAVFRWGYPIVFKEVLLGKYADAKVNTAVLTGAKWGMGRHLPLPFVADVKGPSMCYEVIGERGPAILSCHSISITYDLETLVL